MNRSLSASIGRTSGSTKASDKHLGSRYVASVAPQLSSLPGATRRSQAVSKTVAAESSSLEHDYIKNLKKQIHFLELEVSYLKDKAAEATEYHPKMAEEAERMIALLRDKEGEIDDLKAQIAARDAQLTLFKMEADTTVDRQTQKADSWEKEREDLKNEIKKLIRAKESADAARIKALAECSDAKQDAARWRGALDTARKHTEVLRKQLTEESDIHKSTLDKLERKSVDCARFETRLHQLQRAGNSEPESGAGKELTEHYREEIRLLRQRLKNSGGGGRSEAIIETVSSTDKDALSSMQRQLDLERQLTTEARNVGNSLRSALDESRENESRLKARLARLQTLYSTEQSSVKALEDQVSTLEAEVSTLKASEASTKVRLMNVEGRAREMENVASTANQDNIRLQIELRETKQELDDLKEDIREKGKLLGQARLDKQLAESVAERRWAEVDELASSLRTLTATKRPKDKYGASLRTSTLSRFDELLDY